MTSKIAVIILIVVLAAGVLLAVGSLPTSAFNGGQTVTICTLNLTLTGTYNDNGFSRWISSFNVAYSASGCHTQTLLDLVPGSPSYNLFAFSFSFGLTLIDSQGVNHCQCTSGVNVPALQTAYGFTSTTQVANVPIGAYTLTVTSPFPFGSGSGSTIFSQQIVVAQ